MRQPERRVRPVLRTAVLLAGLLGGLGQAWAHAAPHDPSADRDARVRDLTARAIALEHGEGVARDPIEAADLYCQAAKLGGAEAQYSLGWMFANGRGLPRDDGLAAVFFAMAAKQGHAHAANMLRRVGEPAAEQPECLKPQAIVRIEARPETDDETWQSLFGSLTPERKRIVELVHELAPRYAIDPRLALAVITVESNFQPAARSPKNAQGLMQLIPETAERFNVRNPYDPVQNIKGGLAYLRWLLAYFKGDVALAAAGYNAGERAVDRYRGVPPYQETQSYVRKILSFFRKELHPFDDRVTDPSPVIERLRSVKF